MTQDLEMLEQELGQMENIKERQITPENPLKELFVNYVGEKLDPEDGKVTVEMIVSVLAEEFPEFVLVMAEENFIQGYKQAMADVESWNNAQVENEEDE